MITSVVYKNGDIGMIGTSSLNALITSKKTVKFLRTDGWVTMGIDSPREKKKKYKGPEKRIRSISPS
jgi:hypothetical protein